MVSFFLCPLLFSFSKVTVSIEIVIQEFTEPPFILNSHGDKAGEIIDADYNDNMRGGGGGGNQSKDRRLKEMLVIFDECY